MMMTRGKTTSASSMIVVLMMTVSTILMIHQGIVVTSLPTTATTTTVPGGKEMELEDQDLEDASMMTPNVVDAVAAVAAAASPALVVVCTIVAFVFLIVIIGIQLIYPIIYPPIIEYPWNDSIKKSDRLKTIIQGKDATSSSSSSKSQQQQQQQPNDGADESGGDGGGRGTVIFAASYNPPHKGHLAMLEFLSTKFDKVIAVVGYNPSKKYQVTPHQRADLLRQMIIQHDQQQRQQQHQDDKKTEKNNNSSNIEVHVVDGYIWRYAKKLGRESSSSPPRLFFRGIRSWSKDGQDERSLQILNTWGPMLLGPFVWPLPTVYLEGDPKYNHISSTLIRTICSSPRSGSHQVSDKGKSSSSTNASASNVNTNDAERDSERRATALAALQELVPSNVAQQVLELYSS